MTSTTPGFTLSRREFGAGLFAAAGLALMGCGGSSNGTDADGVPASGPRILRAGLSGELRGGSLDPSKTSPEMSALAYDPLIQQAPGGELEPGLAASWQYVGEGNRTFEITLRPDVTFSDGEPLNGEAVKANIDYYRDPTLGSPALQFLAGVAEVQVVDDLTVRVQLTEPNPLMPQIFASHHFLAGRMISPAAIADPQLLSTATFGAGPYILDPAETVQGDTYTYVPNPTYWNKDSVRWDKVVVSYRPDENATLAALQSGQIDTAVASFATAGAGVQAGLEAIGPGTPIIIGLSLWDRAGAVVPALGDVRVRQALNYAVDRQRITEALVGEAGIPTDQLSAPNQDGWSDEGFYPYDPDRAKSLLADAGYADGFSLPIIAQRFEFLDRVVQAIGDDLRQIGVELDIEAVPEYNQGDDAGNRNYGAGLLGWGVFPAYLMGRSFWLPDATNNPFDSADETLVDLDRQAAEAGQEARVEFDRQIIARVAEQAWFLPVLLNGETILFNGDLVEIPAVEPGEDLPQYPFYGPAGA